MMDGKPPHKKPRLDTDKCIICFKPLKNVSANDKIVQNPTWDGISKILQIAYARNDDVFIRLSPVEDQIRSNDIKVSFHKSCRAKYTSSSNNYKYISDSPSGSANNPGPSSIPAEQLRRKSARTETTGFDIRRDCLICGKDNQHRNHKSNQRIDHLTDIQTGTGKSTRDKLLNASEQRGDDVVHHRMLTNIDLFAADAKYHRGCYQSYISGRNILSCQRKAAVPDPTGYDKAFEEVVDLLHRTVLSKDMEVTKLVQLRTDYVNRLAELGVDTSQSYSSWKLKQRLLSHFDGKLVFVERPGRSDLVCSSAMTVGNALQKASYLDETNPDIELEDLGSMPTQLEDSQVLHMAASILRQSMAEITNNDTYISSMDIDVEQCRKYVPNKMYDFIMWCVNKTSFEKASSLCDELQPKNDLKIISMCHTLIHQCQQVRTPLSLGLAVRVHHNFGSRALIEELHALGYCVSYDEIRRFLTSVALDQKHEGVFVPRGLQKLDDSTEDSTLVDAAIDNFDQKEATLDGNSTTHAMAAVVYKRTPVDPSYSRIPRVQQTSLSAVQAFDINDGIDRYVVYISDMY